MARLLVTGGMGYIGSHTLLAALEMIRLFEVKSGGPVPFSIFGRLPGNVASSWADPSRAAAELSWRATHDAAAMCVSAWAAQARRFGRTTAA